MRRRLLIAPVLAVALATAVTTAAAGDSRIIPAGVKLKACSIEEASALFVAHVRQVTGSEHMWLRFRLLEKGDTGFHPLKAPGLGRWRKSKPGVPAFSYKQAVRGLEAGSLYKAEVDFRWYDPSGNVILTARRRSQACRQFDVLPNLTATPVGTKSLRQAGVVGYRVLVTNEGIATATGVPVRLKVDGNVVDTVTVPTLMPAERRVLLIQGPACTTSIEAEADPDGVIVESSEADNAHQISCADLQ